MTSEHLGTSHGRKSALLGDLVVAAFDAASDVCPDRREARRLATRTVTRMLRRGRAASGPRRVL